MRKPKSRRRPELIPLHLNVQNNVNDLRASTSAQSQGASVKDTTDDLKLQFYRLMGKEGNAKLLELDDELSKGYVISICKFLFDQPTPPKDCEHLVKLYHECDIMQGNSTEWSKSANKTLQVIAEWCKVLMDVGHQNGAIRSAYINTVEHMFAALRVLFDNPSDI